MLIKVDHEYHVVELHNRLPPPEMFDWLEEHMGDSNQGRWWFKFPNVYFADKKDHLMFTLRWS